jgi:aspartate kinase
MDNNLIVTKFGGSSVANAEQIEKVRNILAENKERKVVIVSAPGKDDIFQYKVTDLLYNLYYSVNKFEKREFPCYQVLDEKPDIIQGMVFSRLAGLKSDLGLSKKITNEIKERISIKNVVDKSVGDIVALGEYFSAKMIAENMGFDFVDAADLIRLRKDGTIMQAATADNIQNLKIGKKPIVIPGFYGSILNSKELMTFQRGGSDLTGSIIAEGLDAKLYENWTDRDGIYACDPRLFSKEELNGKPLFIIPKMSYKETRELTYMGFEVFNDESIGPLVGKNIPLLIKNTNNPSAKGTLISNEYDTSRPVRGIAGKNGFASITLEKYLMNKNVGFGAKFLGILSDYGINYEHSPSGIDSMSVILEQKPFERYKRDIMGDIDKKLSPDNVSVKENLGLVAVVGEGMRGNCSINSRIMQTLASENIRTEIISQGASENNIILGIKGEDYKRAIKSLYHSLI